MDDITKQQERIMGQIKLLVHMDKTKEEIYKFISPEHDLDEDEFNVLYEKAYNK